MTHIGEMFVNRPQDFAHSTVPFWSILSASSRLGGASGRPVAWTPKWEDDIAPLCLMGDSDSPDDDPGASPLSGPVSLGTPPVGSGGVAHNLPSIRNPHLVGRDREIHGLHNLLFSRAPENPTPMGVLTGTAGTGKTQIALEYAYRHLNKYKRILWIDASGRELRTRLWQVLLSQGGPVARQLASVTAARALLPEGVQRAGAAVPAAEALIPDERQVAAALQDALSGGGLSLLILDALDQPAQLTALLPQLAQTHVIITSCRRDLPGVLIPVEELSVADAVTLVTGRQNLPRRERQSVQDLCAELGCLPLALSLAARVLERQESLPSELLDDVRRCGALRWLDDQAEEPLFEGCVPLATRLSGNSELLGQRTRGALAKLLPVLHSAPVSEQDLLGSIAYGNSGDEDAINDALGELIALGFVQPLPNRKLYTNRLILQFLRLYGSSVEPRFNRS